MERLYLFLPSFDSCKDSVGFRDPDERFGVGIGLSDEAIDGSLEIIDGSETPRLRRRRVSLAKEPSTVR